MIPELGQFSLILALCLAMIQVAGLVIPQLRPATYDAIIMQAMCLTIGFTCLIIAHLDSDFSVLNVVVNSHSTIPILYKISGAWGNHEGSFLLWIWILGLYGAVLAVQNISSSQHSSQAQCKLESHNKLPLNAGVRWHDTELLSAIRLRALGIHGILQAGFLLFLLLTSNPFERVANPPLDGNGLNPLLQDVGLAIHPPMLYFGYVGFGIVFTLGMAALWQGKPLGKEFATFIRPWILVPWGFMGLGIGLGSWWAYRELGWGGWWFWDPVENSSLLPWLSGCALLHANTVLLKRGQLLHWVVLLSIITFSLSLIGTFLVRSGIITSVHSFASDPERGVFILTYLVLISGSALTLYAFRAHKIGSGAPLMPFSREGSIVINNLFLLVATASILLATLYPMLQELTGARSVTIGAPYFNKTFFPLMTPLMILAGIGSLLSWRKASVNILRKQLRLPLFASITALTLTYALWKSTETWLYIGNALGTWIIFGTLQAVRKATNGDIHKLTHLSSGFYSMVIAHIGLGLLVSAIACSGLLKQETEFRLSEGQSGTLGKFRLAYDHFGMERTPSYIAFKPYVTLHRDNEELKTLRPERRLYPVRSTWTTEAAIYSDLWQDVYVALRAAGPTETEKKQGLINPITVTLYIKPAIPMLWLSMMLIGLGGFVWFFGKALHSLKGKTHG